MIYNYHSNKEFIKDVNILFKKLEKNNLWNENTLVIGMDKAVRPLAYTLKRISYLKKKKSPKIKFFNYSSQKEHNKPSFETLSSFFEKRFPKETLTPYKNILVLDEYSCTGKTLKMMERILLNSLNEFENNLKISFVVNKTLSTIYYTRKGETLENFIYGGEEFYGYGANEVDTGIKNFEIPWNIPSTDGNMVTISRKINNEDKFKQFISKRKQLSKDISLFLKKN